jgi:CRP/FNR family transcriptional regulator, cyclic AMP receptor protein
MSAREQEVCPTMRSEAQPAVLLLDADRELAAGLSAEQRAVAHRHLRARVVGLEPGRWLPDTDSDWAGHLGFLVLDGIIARDVSVRGRCSAELVGAGDVLRPWDEAEDADLSIGHEWQWDVLEPTRLAVLDARTALVAGRWPAVVESLIARSVRRSRMLALQFALTQVAGVDVRLHLMLWHLADRWGRVTPDGVVLRVRLTHELLGRLVGAQRQSVTSALRRLAQDDLVHRLDDGAWLLQGAPDEVELEHASSRSSGPVPVAA